MEAVIMEGGLSQNFYITIDGKVVGSAHASLQEAYAELLALNHDGLTPFEMTVRFRALGGVR